MPKILPLQFYLPKNPKRQVIKSVETFSEEEKKAVLQKHPNSFLHVISAGVDLHSNVERNRAIRQKWESFLQTKQYSSLKKNTILYYSITDEKHVFDGFLCGIALEDFISRRVTKHEDTIYPRVEMMSEYLKTVNIQTEPVMVVHEDINDIIRLEDEIPKSTPPLMSFTIEKKTHALWLLNDHQEKEFIKISQQVNHFHLADGHHRSACVEMIQNTKTKGNPLSVYSFLIGKKKLQNKSFFWYLKKLSNAIDSKKILRIIQDLKGQIVPIDNKLSEEYPLLIALNKTTYAIPKASIQVETIPDFICQAFFYENNSFLKELNFWPQEKESSFVELSEYTSFDLAFSMYPISLNKLFELALNNNKLPPKSTYLLPKLLTGLAITSL